MKDTLQLHEIAGYLSYGLPIQILNHQCDYVGIEFSKINGYYFIGEMLHVTYEGGSTGKDVSIFKPILRPISDLTNEELQQIISHIFRDTRMIRPKMDSVKFDKGFLSFYDLDTSQTYVAVKPGSEGLPVMNMSNTFNDYSIFFKLKVDMFNLIGRGLAIDINTLKD